MPNQTLPLPEHNVDQVAASFPILAEMVFLNHAGVAPISPLAANALHAYAEKASNSAYVGAAWYPRAVRIKDLVARLINADSADEIAFVPNTSAGLALVARGLDWRAGDNVVITDVEYPANRYPWQDLGRFGVELVEVRQQPDGTIDPQQVIDAITDRTHVVSLSHVQYASGYKIDLTPIADAAHAKGAYLCVDAIQSVGVMPVDAQALGIDFLAADGHKWMLSPEGCGIFYCRRDLIEKLHPAVVGWMNMVDATNYGDYRFKFDPTARRFEPGSYNLPGIFALGASIKMLLDVGLNTVWQRVEAVTTHLCDGLADKGYRVFSPRGPGQRSAIVSFEPPDPAVRETPPVDRIVTDLQRQQIIIVTREGRLRASPHFYNTPQQIDTLLDALP